MNYVSNNVFFKRLQSDREIDVMFWKKHPELRKQLVDDTYSDKAHFIYELLQNAEDAKASKVTFELRNDHLVFNHDGKKLFTERDIEAITDVSKSGKSDTNETIGKFGIGFKSVFKYTETPHIYSGLFSFKISNFVYPEPIPVISGIGEETRFLFPFDNSRKPPIEAAGEIEKGLRSLEDNTLLFLSHIRKIDYQLPDGLFGSLERVDHDIGHIEICSSHPGENESASHWFRFEKDAEVTDDSGEAKICRIAIAYSIEEEGEKKKKGAGWKIVPLDHGQVSIYFPAVEETSSLRFHIHAPFASTVTRANVTKEDIANQALRDHLSELVVESLISIRDMGMLTVAFLATLPNPDDNLPKFYKPIHEAIINAFKEQELTPLKEGGHAPSSVLLTGPASISDVLKDADLSQLTGRKMPLWAAHAPPQSKREKAFLDSLEVEEWDWYELSSVLTYDSCHTLKKWLQSKDDTWLQRFYFFLSEAKIRKNFYDSQMTNFSVVRTTLGELRKGCTCYFPSEEDGTTRYSFVKSTLLEHKDETKRKEIRSLLETLGVKSLGEHEEIEALLVDEYSSVTLRVNTETHLLHIKKLIFYWKNHSEKLPTVFAQKKLFIDNQTKSTLWEPHQLYLDKPFLDTGLDDLFNDHSLQLLNRKQALWHGYDEISDFTLFAVAMGVMAGIEIRRHDATVMQSEIFNEIGHKTDTTKNDDFFINGLKYMCESSKYYIGGISLDVKNPSLSKVIWKTLYRIDPKKFEAYYLPNKSNRTLAKRSSAFFINQLKSARWIPDRNGKYFLPAYVTKETIHPDFLYDDWNGNGCLTAIGFGENAIKRSEEYQANNQTAQKWGFASADNANKWAELEKLGVTPDEVRAKYKPVEQPEASVPLPEQRRKSVLEHHGNAPPKESVIRERSIQPGLSLDIQEAKAYLRAKYTNPDGQLICQCCRREMPFKIRDNHYFEAVQCVKGLKKLSYENRLALCPTCAAMYQHARETDDTEMRRRIVEHGTPENTPSAEIPVRMAGHEYCLRFVGHHWFDLKTILSVVNYG